jgi:WD40 repeat protein
LALRYTAHQNAVKQVAWSPDGKHIASASQDHTVQVWDAATAKTVLTLSDPQEPFFAVAWSPDGKRLAGATGYDDICCSSQATVGKVIIWDATSGKPELTYSAHTQQIFALAWSSDGSKIASGGDDTTVRVWNATSGTTLAIYHGHTKTVWYVNWSLDGTRLASASQDGTAQIWQIGA